MSRPQGSQGRKPPYFTGDPVRLPEGLPPIQVTQGVGKGHGQVTSRRGALKSMWSPPHALRPRSCYLQVCARTDAHTQAQHTHAGMLAHAYTCAFSYKSYVGELPAWSHRATLSGINGKAACWKVILDPHYCPSRFSHR